MPKKDKKMTDTERRRTIAAEFKEGITQDIEELLTQHVLDVVTLIDEIKEGEPQGKISIGVKLSLSGADLGTTCELSYSTKTKEARTRTYEDPAQETLALGEDEDGA